MQKSTTSTLNRRLERGQSAVIVALLLVAMVGMLALTFDGGYTYFQRRLAQTAADAGALAGASVHATLAQEAAADYAVTHNAAATAEAAAVDGLVTVSTTISFQTVFAGVLGVSEMTVPAVASAGCFLPASGAGALPVAWVCQPPMNGAAESDDCQIAYGPDHDFIIMDSRSSTSDCQEPPNSGLPVGAIDCDFVPSGGGDGINDVTGQGDRSWLDMDGGGSNANELQCFINPPSDGACPLEVPIHTWREGQTGVAGSVFQEAELREGDNVIIPVYDKACESGFGPPWTPGTSCHSSFWDEGDTYIAGNGSGYYYHIASFAIFHITCVHDTGQSNCPIHLAAVTAGIPGMAANTKTIEGHFVEGFVPGITGQPYSGGVDVGAYTVYLTQ
jgi:hypothetical protein